MLGKLGKSAVAGLMPYLKRLGWFYVLGIVLALAALFGFGELSEEVLEGDVQPVNVAVLQSLHAYSNPFLDRVALALTTLGGVAGTTVIACLAGILFLWRRRFFDAATLALVVLGGGAFVTVLKHTFRQPRPDLYESLAPVHGFAFPSGHALLSVCLYGYLAAVLVLDGPRRWWRWLGAAALLLLAVGICWSRLYLGVHWLSDVAAGCLVALFWLTCCLLTGRYAVARRERGAELPQANQVGAQTRAPENTGWLQGWKRRVKDLKRDAFALYLACGDRRTPWYAKVTAALVVGYAFSPIDLIPDFIPVLGQLDDLVLVPLGVLLVRRMIPADLMDDCRRRAEEMLERRKPVVRVAAVAIVLLWVSLAYLSFNLLVPLMNHVPTNKPDFPTPPR